MAAFFERGMMPNAKACEPFSVVRLDGRSREARLLRRMRAELTDQLGEPSFAERVLIEQAARLQVRLALIEKRIGTAWTGAQTDADLYDRTVQSLVGILAKLGLKAAADREPDIFETIRREATEKALAARAEARQAPVGASADISAPPNTGPACSAPLAASEEVSL